MKVKDQEYVFTKKSPSPELYTPWFLSLGHALPLAFAFGISLYFSLKYEPSLTLSFCVIPVCALGAFVVRHHTFLFVSCLFILLVALGFWRAGLHTYHTQSPRLTHQQVCHVTGWIEKLEKRENKRFYALIRVSSACKSDRPPYRVGITGYHLPFEPGDTIKVKAMLRPPPQAFAPGGYDVARSAYFKRIGAYGYTLGPWQPSFIQQDSIWKVWERRWVQWRWGLSKHYSSFLSQPEAGIATALLTGIRSSLDSIRTEQLRQTGLAHILAISGLHMGLVAGGVFAVSWFFLALITPLSRRFDVRRPASVLGLIAAFSYLLLSGGSVPTQRAFIMVVVVFLALFFNRKVLSLRSLALAALLILWQNPESLLQAGFQLSFAATSALIVVYNIYRKSQIFHYLKERRKGFFLRPFTFFLELVLTSFIAGLATGGFAALHFQKISVYGLFANIVAMPLFVTLIMPAGILALFLTPFGGEGFALALMGWGLKHLLLIVDFFASLPGSSLSVKAAPPIVLPLYGLGFFLFFLNFPKLRLLAPVLILGGLGLWAVSRPADIWISRQNRQGIFTVLSEKGGQANLIVSHGHGRSYSVRQVVRQSGFDSIPIHKLKDSEHCDSRGCIIYRKGYIISAPLSLDSVQEDCARSDLLLWPEGLLAPQQKTSCKAHVLDRSFLQKRGACLIWLLPNRGRHQNHSDPTQTKTGKKNIKVKCLYDKKPQRLWSMP